MRRYTAIIIAVISLLATSCEMGHGTMYRQPIDIGDTIAEHAHMCITQTNKPIMIALLCNTYYSTEDETIRESIEELIYNIVGAKIDRNDTKSAITITDMTSVEIFYSFNTSEGLLSEGGTWSLGDSYTILFTPKEEGIEVIVDIPEYYSNPGNASYMVQDISYDIENGLNYKLSGSIELQYGNDGTTLKTTISEPLSYSTMSDKHSNIYNYTLVGFYDGSAEAVYHDAVSDTYDNVHMEYTDSEYIKVSYLGYTGRITNN
ncbi:MAG: hypothetical protein J6V26_04005 [Alistipes sp.]|nr:hypothetical protein [Alistipes sp.]